MALAVTAAVAIAEVRARAKSKQKDFVRAPDTDILLRRSAEEATTTREGVTHLLPAYTVIS